MGHEVEEIDADENEEVLDRRLSRPPWNFGDGHRLVGYAATSLSAS
jgi:hypothetical protein